MGPANGGESSRFFEEKNKFIIDFNDAVSGIWIRSHDRGAAGCVACRDLLPNDGPHVVKTDCLAELDDFSSDGNDLVPAVVDGPRELVADINAQATPIMQDSMAFLPDQIQIIDVVFIGVIEADLVGTGVIFKLPVGRRRDDQMNRFVRSFKHGTRICRDDSMPAHETITL